MSARQQIVRERREQQEYIRRMEIERKLLEKKQKMVDDANKREVLRKSNLKTGRNLKSSSQRISDEYILNSVKSEFENDVKVKRSRAIISQLALVENLKDRIKEDEHKQNEATELEVQEVEDEEANKKVALITAVKNLKKLRVRCMRKLCFPLK
ncbi:hypothetical protein HK098_000962 [Nowakowskiella sp. JEL0407]|nr:hypothetical protein HK098_000962 [Nowakowskiella sp. JEL0407]